MGRKDGDVERGAVVAVGSRSVVHAWGADQVAKVPNDSTPVAWIRHEAQFTSAVWALGVPAHRHVGLFEEQGKVVSIFERVAGPTLWSLIVEQPRMAERYGVLLGELHVRVLTVSPPVSLPRQADRLRCKLRRAGAEFEVGYAESTSCLPEPCAELSLCHGDFHPANVIMSPDGPVVVDWFDACRGDAACDVARTSLLLGAGGLSHEQLLHLPGHTSAVLRSLHAAYIDTVVGLLDLDIATVEKWRRVEAIARLAEGIEPGAMLALWHHRPEPDHAPDG